MIENFHSKKDQEISKKFEKKGFIIFKIEKNLIDEINKIIKNYSNKKFKIKKKVNINYLLNNLHKFIETKKINKIRMDIINEINNSKKIKKLYYEAGKKILNTIVGNELVMQKKINLSIQLPNDNSSLLALHSDIWSGDSPYEVVIWIPLVNCYRTKSMYILKANKYKKFEKNFQFFSSKNSDYIFNKIKKDINWIKINRGEALIFNQALPHGNIVNQEKETRWSLNCRFKSMFSPYGDKKINEFFEPITIRKISEIGMSYKFPGIK